MKKFERKRKVNRDNRKYLKTKKNLKKVKENLFIKIKTHIIIKNIIMESTAFLPIPLAKKKKMK